MRYVLRRTVNKSLVAGMIQRAARILIKFKEVSMGYTHYWSHDAKLNGRRLYSALNDCRKIVDEVQRRGVILRGGLGEGEPQVSEGIWLNGDGEDSHDTFGFPLTGKVSEDATRLHGCFWDFCKTVRKPYDLAVCAILLVLKHHLGSQIRISSDGGREPEEWIPAEELVKEVLGYEVMFRQEETLTKVQV